MLRKVSIVIAFFVAGCGLGEGVILPGFTDDKEQNEPLKMPIYFWDGKNRSYLASVMYQGGNDYHTKRYRYGLFLHARTHGKVSPQLWRDSSMFDDYPGD